MDSGAWITDALVLLPLGAALAVWLLPLPRAAAGVVALAASLGEIALWAGALARFDFARGLAVQLEERAEWFGDLGVSYHVGFTGFALWLAGLTVVVMAATVAYAMWTGRERPRAYYGLLLFLTSGVVGVFAAQDYLLFYVFWEAMLIPLYILIGVWGGPGRLGATLKFVIYTMAGSLLMLASIIVLGLQSGTFDMGEAPLSSSAWVFLGFAAAFAVKAPLFPFHGWLPDAYRQSPPEVAAILSGVVSKAAAYGFLAIAILRFNGETVRDLQGAVLALAAVGIVYGSLLAFRAPDARGVVAYSSLAQLGLITLGLFALNLAGFNGAVLQMVNHGLISAILFLLCGVLEQRTGTGTLHLLGGMARGRPALATLILTTGVIALAVPGSTAFAGEFLILTGVFDEGYGWAVVGAAAMVLAAMYMLRLISAVLHERPGPAVGGAGPDLRAGELGVLVPLLACLLALSAWPAAVTSHTFGQTGATPPLSVEAR